MQRTRRGNRTKYLIALFIAAIIIVAVFVAIYLWPRGLPPATKFFNITPTISIGTFGANNRSVLITTLGVNVTPVLGDANIVYISVRSHDDKNDETNQAGNISKGQTIDFAIMLQGYQTTLHNINGTDVFPVDIQIGSVECQYETVTLYIKPEEIV